MEAKKVKFVELVKPSSFVEDAMAEAKLNKDGKLTSTEMQRIEKKVLSRVLSELESALKNTLEAGDSVEIPGMLNISKIESSVHKNKNGQPKKRLTIRTRTAFMRTLNNEL